VLATCGVGGI